MNVKSTLLSSLVVMVIAVVACSKNPTAYPQSPRIAPPVDNKEYFWGQQWQTTASGKEMKIISPRLTDSAINKGIRVSVAIYSAWSFFWQLPLTVQEAGLADTVNLSYTVVPGKLTVLAKAPFDIDWESDVRIDY